MRDSVAGKHRSLKFYAERPRFELGIPFWSIHAFQASQKVYSRGFYAIIYVLLAGYLRVNLKISPQAVVFSMFLHNPG